MSVAENIAGIKAKIAKTCAEYGREPSSVSLVAVSKMQPVERIQEALAAGQRLFGENRVQEAKARWQDLRAAYPDLKLHLIGPLQTNKVKEAVKLFDCIETVDRVELVDAIVKALADEKSLTPALSRGERGFFVQVNTGDEEQKAGVSVEGLPALLDYAVKAELNVTGLMCIPPVDEPPALHFALLRKLALRHGLPDLSMGMSADYERAVVLGATYVRVGTALFGKRG